MACYEDNLSVLSLTEHQLKENKICAYCLPPTMPPSVILGFLYTITLSLGVSQSLCFSL